MAGKNKLIGSSSEMAEYRCQRRDNRIFSHFLFIFVFLEGILHEISQNIRSHKGNQRANPTGAIRIDGNRFLSFGKVGSADIIGILPDGKFLAVECKSDNGRLSEAQKIFLDKIKNMGGISVVARTFKDIEKILIENKYL